MCIEHRPLRRTRQRGLTLIELVVFIVVVSIGIAGILGVMNLSTRNSVNPMLLKQQVAIAESLLEEIRSKPFTWCDPDDDKVATANSAADCSVPQKLEPTTSDESRYKQLTPYDNVGDYNGFAMNSGILNPVDGSLISGLAGYKAVVAVSEAGSALGLDNTAALRIDVSVTAPDGNVITLTGYRSRNAPRL